MDGAAAASTSEAEVKEEPFSGDSASENATRGSSETTTQSVGDFCCHDCGEAFREEASYLEHCKLHTQENLGLNFGNHLDSLRDSAKDGDTTNVCNLCSLSFVELSEFHSHMEKLHGQTSQNESSIQIDSGPKKQHTYECPDCGKIYGMLGHLLNHQRSHMQPSKSLFFRNLEHLEKKAFQCETCGRNYSRASALDAHRRCHEEKLIKSRNRSSEDSSHTGARPSENQTADIPEKLFKCSCGKAFTASMRLKTHQRFSRNSRCTREEMKEKPRRGVTDFYCSDCDKYFNGHLAFINHQRWHANRSEDPKRFLCKDCGKEFMTLTFYYRHQRTVHATPAKSFLQQVCELQKKAFECQTCGLKFSRASALQSHQLQHTDAFSETEKILPLQTSLLPQEKVFDRDREETEPLEEQVEAECLVLPRMSEVSFENDSDEDMDSYELGDFNVQVISASESEDESTQDTNPDLELVCESDQEGREDGETVIATSCLVSKTDMDLKIVQIDLEPAEEQTALVATDAESHTEKRFDCPQCYRWFTSKASLGVHKMWHGIRKKRQQHTGQSVTAYTCDTSYYESSSFASHCDHIKEHKGTDRNNHVLKTEGELVKNPLSCDDCGKCFTRLSALVSHQSNHPKRKPFQCPDCIMSFSHEATLFTHMNHCSAQKKENISVTKKEYNPTKTLLGPKIYHCEQCGKGFWSLGAFSHHKQSPNQCADSRLRKGVAGSLNSVNGGPRSSIKVACPVCGRKFRHKGIMTLHMRKHENGNHKCELCDRSFRLFSSLVRHQVVHSDQLLPPPIKSFQHQVEQLKKNTYSCPDCGKLFSRAKALQFHMKSHGYETGHSPSSPRSSVTLEELQCATCLAYFNSKASLRAHQKLCVKKDVQIVQYKTENFENCNTVKSPVDSMGIPSQEMNSIDVDIEKDTDAVQMGQTTVGIVENTDATDLKYKCKRCNRSFSVIGALNLHKRIHTKGRKSLAKAKSPMSRALKEPKEEELSQELFDCSECGMGFMSSSALDAHKRLHSERTFSQSLLKEQSDLRMDRLTTDIKVEPDSALDHAGFSCPECNKTFMEGALLSAHYDDEHSQILPAAYLQGDECTSKSVGQVPQELAIIFNESESNSSALRPKTHQCPLCSLAFAKARGLNAHKWQVHFKITKDKIKFPLHLGSINTEESSAVGKKNCSVERGQQTVRMENFPLKFITCLECGKQCRNAVALLDHRKVCSFIKQESKLEVETPEASAEVSSQLGRLPEHSAKYLFKCGDCGKAFQTEEQLGAHKTKAKSRPYCCALCCHGFWTENQLQQHLVWHDEVRCRLPSEVRFRLSAAMTTKSLKSNLPSTDNRASSFAFSSLGQPELHPESQLQSSHRCQHCGKAFLSPAALQNHQTLYCNNDSYHCTICSRTFSEIQDLIDHHQECISDYKQQNDGPTAASD